MSNNILQVKGCAVALRVTSYALINVYARKLTSADLTGVVVPTDAKTLPVLTSARALEAFN